MILHGYCFFKRQLLLIGSFLFLFGVVYGQSNLPKVRVIVKTEPEGAEIFIDGEPVKGRTPVEIMLNDHQMHMLELRKEGFEPYFRQIPPTIPGDNVIHRFDNIVLTKITVPLIIDSQPQGANVKFNGEDIGKTPIYLPGVSPGSHRLEFHYPGYSTKTFSVEVEKNLPKIINAELESLLGSLVIKTQPGNAEVLLNGKMVGVSSSDGYLKIDNVMEGNHSITVKKRSYIEMSTTVYLKRQEQKIVEVPPLIPQPGSLRVTASEEKALVYLNNKLYGETPLTINNLNPGMVEVTVKKDGFTPVTERVSIQPGITKEINVTLESEFGSVTIITEPSEAKVIIGADLIGITEPGEVPGISKPFVINNLTPGNHTLTIEKAGYTPVTRQIVVVRGKNTIIPTIKLSSLWLPTHRLRVKGNAKTRDVKVLSQTEEGINVEIKEGNSFIRYMVTQDQIEFIEPIK